MITSANNNSNYGTIYLTNSGESTDVLLEITNGTIQNTADNGNTIYNDSLGEVSISGGEVSATTGTAIYNNSAGKITISDTALVTSANNATGTIVLAYYFLFPSSTIRLEITGGTVQGTGNAGYAVRNNSTGTVSISGGIVSSTTAIAVINTNTGEINISGGEVLSTGNTAVYNYTNNGTINISGGTIKNTENGYAVINYFSGMVNISGGTVSATIGYAVYNTGDGTINISGGTVLATTGNAVRNNSAGTINISGADTLITSENSDSYPGNQGTIRINNASGILNVNSGRVENTANHANAKAITAAEGATVNINTSGGSYDIGAPYPVATPAYMP